jgi:hypothetical protein
MWPLRIPPRRKGPRPCRRASCRRHRGSRCSHHPANPEARLGRATARHEANPSADANRMRGPSLGKPGTLVVHILDAPSGKFLGASDERGDDFTKATGQRLRTRATYAPRRRVFGSRATTAPTTAARSLSNPVRLEVRFLIPDGSVPQARFAAFATLATLTLGVTPVGAQPHAGGPREDAGTAAAPDADAPHATLTCEHVPARPRRPT